MALYSEIDSGFEVRKVEVYRDGRHDYAGRSGNHGNDRLGEKIIPGTEEINGAPEFSTAAVVHLRTLSRRSSSSLAFVKHCRDGLAFARGSARLIRMLHPRGGPPPRTSGGRRAGPRARAQWTSGLTAAVTTVVPWPLRLLSTTV